jgi:hypothetical protein
MTTEVPSTEPTEEPGPVEPDNTHIDGTTGIASETVTATDGTAPIKPNNTHIDGTTG